MDLGFHKLFFSNKHKIQSIGRYRHIQNTKKYRFYVRLFRFVHNSGWFLNRVSNYYSKKYKNSLARLRRFSRPILVTRALIRYARRYIKLQVSKYRKRKRIRAFFSSMSSSITNPKLALYASELNNPFSYFFPYERKYRTSFSSRSNSRRSRYISKFFLRR